MANFRRRRRRELGARGRSSDWSYVQIEKGRAKRGHVAIRRLASSFKEKLEQYRRL